MSQVLNEIESAALDRLRRGNALYIRARVATADVSKSMRKSLVKSQNPYAVIVTCSDSRVVPELIFSVGLGELFVIRIAGNVIDNHQLGSIEYAISHCDCPLIVVMGHTHCGAIHAAVSGGANGFAKTLTDEIHRAIGAEQNEDKACEMNVRYAVARIQKNLIEPFEAANPEKQCAVIGAIYNLEDGTVKFLE